MRISKVVGAELLEKGAVYAYAADTGLSHDQGRKTAHEVVQHCIQRIDDLPLLITWPK